MTPETAQFLLDLLGTLTIQTSNPNFLEAAAQIKQAQNELIGVLGATVEATDAPDEAA